jgi:hypothetical protein
MRLSPWDVRAAEPERSNAQKQRAATRAYGRYQKV